MDIYAKYLGKAPEIINPANPADQRRPFFIPKGGVDELNYSQNLYNFDSICWEANIITQIWENKYGWFDFSKNLIDIGAGCGEYPIFAGFAHSYAFEPNKEKQCFLYTNMACHDMITKIDVLPYCISDTPGVRGFTGWSEDMANTVENPSEQPVAEYRTLDSFNIENVGLIKVDIEGFEYYALRSGIGTIVRSHYPPLLIEVWNTGDIDMYFKEKSDIYKERQKLLLDMLYEMGYVKIDDPSLGDWETKFFIHHTQLGNYKS